MAKAMTTTEATEGHRGAAAGRALNPEAGSRKPEAGFPPAPCTLPPAPLYKEYSNKDLALVAQALAGWDMVYYAYSEHGHHAGMHAVALMHAGCPLCAEYLRIVRGRSGAYMKSCRACPVVRATGVRCDTLRARSGMGGDWAAHFDQAIFVITRARRALQRIYDSMTGISSASSAHPCAPCVNPLPLPLPLPCRKPEAGSRKPEDGSRKTGDGRREPANG